VLGASLPDLAEEPVELLGREQVVAVAFEKIPDPVTSVLSHVGDAGSRSERWRAAARAGRFGAIGDIAEYGGPGMEASRAALAGWHRGGASAVEPAYRFYQAAALHRWFVLRDLLPSRGIVLI
jgi:hypothetical protein